MILYTTNKFKKAIKLFKRKHQSRVLDDVWNAIVKIYNQEVGKSMDNHQLSGKHTNGFKDIHLEGGDFILLYRYDVDNDTLIVSAKINDIVTHKELNQKATFAEPQWIPTTFDQLKNDINGSTDLSNLDVDEVEDWFYDFYNEKISKILPMDNIVIKNIVDQGVVVLIKVSGTQYYETCNANQFKASATRIIDLCRSYDVDCTLVKVIKNLKEFRINMTLRVPIEYRED